MQGSRHRPEVFGAQYPPIRRASDLDDIQKGHKANRKIFHGSRHSHNSLSQSGSQYGWDNNTSPAHTAASIQSKREKFGLLLQQPTVELEKLRQLAWSGVPAEFRPLTWKMLSGYVPLKRDRRECVLARKRQQYSDFVKQHCGGPETTESKALMHQLTIDVKRASPEVALLRTEAVQETLVRLLYVWAVRHPASGYVQGMCDLVTPFLAVFLSSYVGGSVETVTANHMPAQLLEEVEADCYWCVTKLLDGIQDNYTFPQSGIQKKVARLADLTGRVDAPLHQHLMQQQVQYMQFSFRWMNCLLMRELPLRCIIRIWDTYLTESNGVGELHVYVCVAFLVHWSSQLRALGDFQGILLFLQNPPTKNWGDREIDVLLAEAFKWMVTFNDAPSHLANQ